LAETLESKVKVFCLTVVAASFATVTFLRETKGKRDRERDRERERQRDRERQRE
jgi:hypothetical protein